MLSALIDLMPRKARAAVFGALALATFVSSTYAIATYAAGEQVAPLRVNVEFHQVEQQKREEYDRELREAMWSDLRALCRKMDADCDGPPLPK